MHLSLLTLLVRDYDEAIAFYTQSLGFTLLEDTDLGPGSDANPKRWVRVAPPISASTSDVPLPTSHFRLPTSHIPPALLLARAVTPAQLAAVGNQTGGRVFLFLETDDIQRDFRALSARGVRFTKPPRQEPYGTVAVFADLYGNLFDLIQPSGASAPPAPPESHPPQTPPPQPR